MIFVRAKKSIVNVSRGSWGHFEDIRRCFGNNCFLQWNEIVQKAILKVLGVIFGHLDASTVAFLEQSKVPTDVFFNICSIRDVGTLL